MVDAAFEAIKEKLDAIKDDTALVKDDAALLPKMNKRLDVLTEMTMLVRPEIKQGSTGGLMKTFGTMDSTSGIGQSPNTTSLSRGEREARRILAGSSKGAIETGLTLGRAMGDFTAASTSRASPTRLTKANISPESEAFLIRQDQSILSGSPIPVKWTLVQYSCARTKTFEKPRSTIHPGDVQQPYFGHYRRRHRCLSICPDRE